MNDRVRRVALGAGAFVLLVLVSLVTSYQSVAAISYTFVGSLLGVMLLIAFGGTNPGMSTELDPTAGPGGTTQIGSSGAEVLIHVLSGVVVASGISLAIVLAIG